MIDVRLVKSDLPRLMRANSAVANKVDDWLRSIGVMLLESAQEAMDKSGPRWVGHARETERRWGIHKLLHTPESGTYKRKDGTPLSDIKANYNYFIGNVFKGKATLEIIAVTSHAKTMYDIHNRPRGDYLTVNNGAQIPGRPFFRWRTGHTQQSEERKAIKITNDYIKDTFSSHGIRVGRVMLDIGV